MNINNVSFDCSVGSPTTKKLQNNRSCKIHTAYVKRLMWINSVLWQDELSIQFRNMSTTNRTVPNDMFDYISDTNNLLFRSNNIQD